MLASAVRLEEAAVHAEQRLLLRRRQHRVGLDRRLGLREGVVVAQARLLEHRLDREVERVCERLHHPHRRSVPAALELAQVGVRELGPRGKLAERELRELALRVDEAAEYLDLLLPGIVGQAAGAFHVSFSNTGSVAAKTLSVNSRCAFSSCSANS